MSDFVKETIELTLMYCISAKQMTWPQLCYLACGVLVPEKLVPSPKVAVALLR